MSARPVDTAASFHTVRSDDTSKQDGPPASLEPRGNVYVSSYAFNQDFSCFVCGTTAGFRVYKVAPLEEVHRRETPPALNRKQVVFVAMLFKTNIFALVTISDDDPPNSGPNKVHIWDDLKQKIVGELRCRNEVRGVALRRDIIAMVCEYTTYIYTCSKLEVIATLPTVANGKGLCALAPSGEPWVLCCPVLPKGSVKVQVGQADPRTHVFTPHQSALAALAINDSGALLATASETGTVVKVFNTMDGQLLYRLRRGAAPADVHCLAFQSDKFLAVASCSSSTVHIFKLDPNIDTKDDASTSSPPSSFCSALDQPLPAAGYTSEPRERTDSIAAQIQKAVASVVPSYFSDLGSFAQFRLPDCDATGQPTVDTRSKEARITGPQLAFHSSQPRLSVVHYNGVLYEYTFCLDHDPKQGTQDCTLVGATTWFAVRPDFRVQGPSQQLVTVDGGSGEDNDDAADEWQLL